MRLLFVCLLLAACAPRRSIELEFETFAGADEPTPLSSIQAVTLVIFDGNACACDTLGTAACLDDENIASLRYQIGQESRTGEGFPDGPLVVDARVFSDAAETKPVPMHVDCGCVPDQGSSTLTMSTGSPHVAAGQGCAR